MQDRAATRILILWGSWKNQYQLPNISRVCRKLVTCHPVLKDAIRNGIVSGECDLCIYTLS